MPFLQFRCTACNRVFEELVSAGAQPPRCPDCGGETQRHFKGKCSFGSAGGDRGGGCSGHCANCSGCGGH